jgi:prephenate dehydratase
MTGLFGYLGPPGTFTEEAAGEYCKDENFILRPYPSIHDVMNAIEKKEVDEGIVPVENSLEGTVNLTLECYSRTNSLQIKGELLYKIRQFLLASPGQKLPAIGEVYSHPQALAQCRRFLNEALPGAVLIDTPSTAGAAELVSLRGKRKAAIASRRAAALYGLEVLQGDIQDEPDHNITRFQIISREDAPRTGDDKTSLLIGLQDRPGSLYAALAVFARHNLNLTRIESRPVRGELGKYLFFMDIQGHRKDEEVSSALDKLRQNSLFVKVLGSYPRANRIRGGSLHG